MLKNLFSSEIRIKLLGQFLLHPQESFHLRRLARMFSASPRSIELELKNLERIGLLKNNITGNVHNYSVNPEHPLYVDLQNIFFKTIGIKEKLAVHLNSLINKIRFAFVFGSFATGNITAQSDLDLMIIGNVASLELSSILLKAGDEIGREINFSVLREEEFRERLKNKDHFLTALYNGKKIFVVGEDREFKRLAE